MQEMIILSNNNSKEDVNISKQYGEDALLSKEDFIKKHNITPNRTFFKCSRL